MSLEDIKDKVAIVGVGTTAFGALYRDLDPERDVYELGAVAFKNALDDSGLKKEAIDGLIVSRIPSYSQMGARLGIPHPRLTNFLEGSGRMSGIGLQYAAMAIHAGMADYVACIYGNNGRSVRVRYAGEVGVGGWDGMYGLGSPGAYFAMEFRRHMHLYGTTQEQLAAIPITFRKHAALNPNAVMRMPITLEDYLNARYVAEPLRLFDYCLINDGAVCIILTSAERARDCKKPPVYISGMASCGDLNSQYFSPDLYEAVCKKMADQVYRMAGVTREDIDCLMVYDSFAPEVLFELEGFGFAPKGEGGAFVQDGRIGLGGELPINTNGGHLSESYMQGWGNHVEAIRQLRGECGERQVPNCEIVQYCCASPNCSTHIFRR